MTTESYTEWDAERHGFRRWNPRDGWQPFGTDDADYPAADASGVRVLNLAPGKPAKEAKDRAGTWLRNAMIALALLAGIAAVVSYSAQYWLVYSFKHSTAIAALQAGIPDTGALVFAALGISLALQGRRAIRPRALNVLCVGISIGMNALAASAGWRAMAVWTMAPVLYALASDTLIGVIRAYAIARQRQLREDLADDEVTPLAILGGLLLWHLRLVLAPASTLKGFRAWVVESCPVAPGTRAQLPAPNVAALPAAPTPGSAAIATPAAPAASTPRKPRSTGSGQRGPSKTSRFMDLVAERYPDGLATIDPRNVSQLCALLAPQVGLDPGAARSYLTPRVREAHAAQETEAGR
jgi:hypothetical protein